MLLVPGIAHLGAAAAANPKPPPLLTCEDEEVRLAPTDSRTRVFDPTLNDVTNDGSGITLQSIETPPSSAGTLSRIGNQCTLTIAAGFAGTFQLAYTAVSGSGAIDGATVTVIVEGTITEPVIIGVADTIVILLTATTVDYDVLANDTKSGPAEIIPGSLVQPNGGPTISIVGGLVRVTRNSAAVGNYTGGSYIPRLVDGSKIGVATAITVQVANASVVAPDFSVWLAINYSSPFLIDALARCTASGPIELTPGGLTQPTGSADSAAISGSGATGKIAYTWGATPPGAYTMTYKARLIANTAVEDPGTITINLLSKWWLRPRTSQRDWPAGPSHQTLADWTSKCGRVDALTQISRTSQTDMEGITGGPATDSLTSPTLKAGSQLDPTNPFWTDVANLTPDSAFICATLDLVPINFRTDTGDVSYWDRVISGTYDADFARMGARLFKLMRQFGWSDVDRLVLRPNNEMNKTNVYQVTSATSTKYRTAMEQILTKIREGAGFRVRAVHSPGRTPLIGAYQSWIPQSATGGVDALTLTWHPGPEITDIATFAQFMQQWDTGSYGLLQDVIPACTALGLPLAYPEWSPRFGENGLQACNVADLVMQQFSKYLRAQYLANNLLFDTISAGMLNRDAFVLTLGTAAGQAAWQRMYDQILQIYKSTATVPPPYLRTTGFGVTVPDTGTVDADAITHCTGSDSVRISRVAQADPGLDVSVTGSGTAARVRIGKGTAEAGVRHVLTEMALAAMPYLTDIDISATVTSGGGGTPDTWAVSGSAGDTVDALNIATLCPTIIDVPADKSLTQALSDAGPGTRIRVAAGTYSGTYSFGNAGTGNMTTGVPTAPIYLVAADATVDATSANGVYFSGKIVLDKAWTGVIGRGIRMKAADINAGGCRISRTVWRDQGLALDTSPSNNKWFRFDRNWISNWTGSLGEGHVNKDTCYGMRVYMNYFVNHTKGASDHIFQILTDMWRDTHLTCDKNLFNNVLNATSGSSSQRELWSFKVGDSFVRYNTITNSTADFSMREPTDATIIGNWFEDGGRVLIHGDNHLVKWNHSVGTGAILLACGGAYARKTDGTPNYGDTRCGPGGGTGWNGVNKWGLTVAEVSGGQCRPAHASASGCQVEENTGEVHLGYRYDAADSFSNTKIKNVTFVNNKLDIKKTSGSYVNCTGQDAAGNASVPTRATKIPVPTKNTSTDQVGPWAP